MVAGGTARIWAATLVSPLELIRTKMQSQKLSYGGMTLIFFSFYYLVTYLCSMKIIWFLLNIILEINQALKIVIKYNGIRGLWMGLSSTLLRDVPFSAIYWFNYESIKRTFSSGQPSFAFNFTAGAIAGSVSCTFFFY